MKEYEYIIVGAGICGCSVAYELSKHSKSILLIDKLPNIASGASGAAGAFLSPLLGKPNPFKDLVTRSLKFSTKLYKKNFPNVIDNCGTTRIPQNDTDKQKFESYRPYMDFPYKEDEKGYHFKIGTVVNSFGVCKMMTVSFLEQENGIETLFKKEVKQISYKDGKWFLDNDLCCKNLILSTGAGINLTGEEYMKIRPVWGYRIDVETSTKLEHNYHKACSVSKSFPVENGKFRVSIGATHNRKQEDVLNTEKNNKELLEKAFDIIELEDIEIVKSFTGARACSEDYFPMVGEVINSSETLKEFPYLRNGTHVQAERFTRYKNMFVLNGVGGRGFVLGPYLASCLVEHIIKGTPLDDEIKVDRLFNRYAKKGKI
jgi:glycine/D-amino acid oxidase-like deaminating enzyme